MKRVFVFLLISTFLNSCRKDPDIYSEYKTNPEIVSTVGSWWKYEWFEIDSIGNSQSIGIYDSVYVKGDTLLNGNRFIHFKGTYLENPTSYFWRDSLNCIVNPSGIIIYNYWNFSDTNKVYSYPTYTIYTMTKESDPINVQAGTFDVLDNQTHYHKNNNEPMSNCDTIWVAHQYYANGIGIIADQTAYISALENECTYLEMRLVDYYIAH